MAIFDFLLCNYDAFGLRWRMVYVCVYRAAFEYKGNICILARGGGLLMGGGNICVNLRA